MLVRDKDSNSNCKCQHAMYKAVKLLGVNSDSVTNTTVYYCNFNTMHFQLKFSAEINMLKINATQCIAIYYMQG